MLSLENVPVGGQLKFQTPAPGSLNVVSVCRSLPTPQDPSSGVFVMHRLAALSRKTSVQVLQPVPYFPLVRPLPTWVQAGRRTVEGVGVNPLPMFYVPGVLKPLDGMWLSRAVTRRIDALHRHKRIDIIDAHFGFPEGSACVQIGRRLGVPVFITVRGFENEYLESRNLRAKLLLRALKSATGCICVSQSLKDLVLRHGVPEDRVTVIHNALDREIFSPGDRITARVALGLPQDVPLIISVGHLISRKRHHVLIEAHARLRRRFPRAVLAIIGAESFEPAYPGTLRRMAEKIGDPGAVRFVGNVSQVEVVRWLRAANVFALGTAREGCCNAVLEALAVGVPVVTTPAGDNAYFVCEGVNGHLVPVDDIEAMTRGLETALVREDWDAAAISTGLSVGSWDAVAEQVLNFFRGRSRR